MSKNPDVPLRPKMGKAAMLAKALVLFLAAIFLDRRFNEHSLQIVWVNTIVEAAREEKQSHIHNFNVKTV